jgi:hydrogenase expression/formation protein HypC
MCLAIPMKVESIEGYTALVNSNGVKVPVNIMMVQDVVVGEYLLVHAGFAIEKLNPEEAQKTLDLFKQLNEMPEDQLR